MSTAAPAENEARAAIVAAMRELAQRGLNTGATGNISVRQGDGLLITPTGVAPESLTADAIVRLDAHGVAAPDALRPSSEWQLHAAVYRARPEFGAVVHCHSRHATALACCGRELPAFHYMIAAAGGTIRCAPYALFGSNELAEQACRALEGRRACLLTNHGQLAAGASLAQALVLAVLVEELAATYQACLQVGNVQLLDETQMAAVTARFSDYGQQSRH